MTKVSNEKLTEFRNVAEKYTAMHQGKFSRFLYAVSKMLKATKPLADELNDKITFLNLEYAEKDKQGFAAVEKFTRKNGNQEQEDERYKYTAAQAKKLHEAKRALMQEEVEVETYEAKGDLLEFVPDDMDFHLWQFFSPFVLPEEPEGELFDKLVAKTASNKV